MSTTCSRSEVRPAVAVILAKLLCCILSVPVKADDLDRAPIHYSTANENNAVAHLRDKVDSGQESLAFTGRTGYLKSVLDALSIPISSQVFVFSKTSLQRDRIHPKKPRAIYFNDDVYVGFCQNGNVIELSAADATLGTAFYTLDQQETDKPTFTRQQDNCLVCHSSSASYGYPGHLIRSVYPDEHGQPIFSLGTRRTDHSSPLAERWGGWYVTGTSGSQTHLGNLIVVSPNPKEPIENDDGINQSSLHGRVNTEPYLSGHSDIVALMVLEHQTEMHNRLTRANFQVRQALYEEAEMNEILGQSNGKRSDGIARRIQNAAEQLVEWMLFSQEITLTAPIQGTSHFAKEFAERGPRDATGRSLREFDLAQRIFRYPCSYLIYSKSFDALDSEVRSVVFRRLGEILTGRDSSDAYSHLSAVSRRAILEILTDTKPEIRDFLPAHSKYE